MSVLLPLLLACPPAPKESPPSESGDSDSAENQESPPDTDCTAIEGYTDMDGDGYGDPTQPHTGCVDDPATADNNQDCDDAVATIHPFAEETCDGVDQDCDGERDENATDAQSYYADADGDGHGDPSLVTVACTPPSGVVAQADDCDDSEALAWTGAVEVCGDGVDQDCDPTLHPCLLSGGLYLRDAGFRIEGGNPNDAAGAAVASIGDWDGDGVGDLLIGAPFTSAGGTVYIAPMVTGSLGTQPSWSAGGSGELLGEVVLALPDLDGDGWMEPAAGGSLAGLGYGQLQI
ncbi:MAG TPA: putative metal-binding motif-containing protein, partial [Myxococcota bacterium]|nr:putative metal-binding motif-containing protein [Myxococcota bacterium]